MAKIIVLNGTSSAGKTTLAKELQQQLDEPYLLSGIDKYVYMLPKKYLYQPLWSNVFSYQYEGDRIVSIQAGDFGNRLISAMHHSILGIAESGINVIVDHVVLEQAWQQEMDKIFQNHNVLYVGVTCPLEVLEQREKARKDRTLGQAGAQYNIVHKYMKYHLVVDTSVTPIDDCVKTIINNMNLMNND